MRGTGQLVSDPHVVILGGGFGGLYAAQVLGAGGARVTVADRRNFHLFQPLLYQVATGGLSPGDIFSPIRAVLNRYPRVRVLQADAVDVHPDAREVIFRDAPPVRYDALVVSVGSRTSYFGHDEWAARAAGLKTIEDALDVRRRVLGAFERAEKEPDAARVEALLAFVVVGGGPTGVELAGAVAELARSTLARDFRAFDPRRARVILVEAGDRILPAFPSSLSRTAARALERLGVEVRTGVMVTGFSADGVTTAAGGETRAIAAATVLWAAGVTASPLGGSLAKQFGAEHDRSGRIVVGPDLTIPGHLGVYVIGDLAHAGGPDGKPLPGLAPVAIQQGRYVARRILGRIPADRPFRYRDQGQLAVIGRNHAVADFGRLRFSGFPAWVVWVFVHITQLIEFDNRVLVLVQWAFNYFTRKRGARLITGAGNE
jgi:NADH dehydrogenase